MSKIIHNLLEESKTYGGMIIPASESYLISEEELRGFQNDINLHNAINAEIAEVVLEDSNAPGIFLSGVNGIRFLLSNMVIITETPAAYPFKKKCLESGNKLFRRKHGIKETIPANSSETLSIIVPYNNCKIDELEIVNGKIGDTVDLKVYDTPEGLIQMSMGVPPEQIIPSKMLNQFGFGANICEGYYKDKSDYDADLIKDLKVEVTYYNNGDSDLVIGANFILHQIV